LFGDKSAAEDEEAKQKTHEKIMTQLLDTLLLLTAEHTAFLRTLALKGRKRKKERSLDRKKKQGEVVGNDVYK
jgi:hypothetical protein